MARRAQVVLMRACRPGPFKKWSKSEWFVDRDGVETDEGRLRWGGARASGLSAAARVCVDHGRRRAECGVSYAARHARQRACVCMAALPLLTDRC